LTIFFLTPMNERNEYRESATDKHHHDLSSHLDTESRFQLI
jgi:hypothetical protein